MRVNRLIIILLAVILIVANAVFLLTWLHVVDLQTLGLSGVRETPDLLSWTAAVSIAIGLIALFLLIFEIVQERSSSAPIVIKEDSLGRVTVALDGVRDMVNREAVQVDGVTQARSRVQEDGKGLRIMSSISVEPEACVPEMSTELQTRLKKVVEHHVGVPVVQVSIYARVAPLGRRRIQ